MKLLPYAVVLLAVAVPVHARQAAGIDVFASDDADDTSVIKTGVSYDWRLDDTEHYLGIRLEKARFAPSGASTRDTRAYLRFADSGQRWKWNGNLGSDGHTWLGSASLHNEARLRQEYFVEREIVETPIGLQQGIHYTFVGAAYDLPVNDHNTFTVMAGVQDFTGDNTRSHVRARYIHVLDAERGLSVQLRARHFHNSAPREFDYYSPRWYAELLPTLQVRRFRGGWAWQGAAGWGRQRDSDRDWHSARLLEASVTSPKLRSDWHVKANLTYSNTPVSRSYSYAYTQLGLQAIRVF